MELVINLAILIVVCVIARLLLRTKLRVCPHCASLFVDRGSSGIQPPHVFAPVQREEPNPFSDLPFAPEPGLFEQRPLVLTPQSSRDTPPVVSESADDFPVIETHEPVEDVPALPTRLMASPRQTQSGEILIEPASEEEAALMNVAYESRGIEDSGDLVLEQDIGIGPGGLSLASRLIEAGFGVTMTSQKWGGSGCRPQTSDEIDDC